MNSEKLMSKSKFLLFLTSFTLYLPFLYPISTVPNLKGFSIFRYFSFRYFSQWRCKDSANWAKYKIKKDIFHNLSVFFLYISNKNTTFALRKSWKSVWFGAKIPWKSVRNEPKMPWKSVFLVLKHWENKVSETLE